MVRSALRCWRPAAFVAAGAIVASFAPAADAADRTTLAELELSSLLPENGGDGSTGFVAKGTSEDDRSGTALRGGGDVNGDGVDDFIVGAPRADLDPDDDTFDGQAYVVYGRDAGQAFAAELELASLLPANGGDGSAGFVLSGEPAHQVGYAASAAGDFNGDGIDDVVIGAYEANGPGHPLYSGECYVVFGRDSDQGARFPALFELRNLLPANGGNGSAGLVIRGFEFFGWACYALSAAGDVNGDGNDDLIVTAKSASPDGREAAGQAYVLFGRLGHFPPVIELSALLPANGGDGSVGFVLNGIAPSDAAGSAVSAGDVNGDCVPDLVVGAPLANPHSRNEGETYVVFGRDSDGQPFPAVLELSSLLPAMGGDGTSGFVLHGIGPEDRSGGAVSAADINSDGVADLMIGAPSADSGGRSDAGAGYVVFGRDTALAGPFAAVIELSGLLPENGGDGTAGFVLNGIAVGDGAGASLSAAGDVNGDGVGDFIVGASSADPGGRTSAGESYLLYGRDAAQGASFPAVFELSSLRDDNGGDGSTGFVVAGVDPDDISGSAVSTAGDVNDDGFSDLLVGAWRADPNGQSSGESYVVFGRDGDFDDDAIPDDADNCQVHANADQRDTDADGFGNVCDPDLNQDGVVNFSDLGELKLVFFTADPDADFDGDGAVNFADLATLKSFFFLAPGPSGALQ